MKYFQQIIVFSLVIVLCLSCMPSSNKDQIIPNNVWPYGAMYEIFVQSFADSNGDGIGDINGMTAKLDYLQDLGIEGVWLMPISPSPSYHKYDVTDYEGIHPDYGTMKDFKRFVKQAHKRNIKVVTDLVINHTSSQHPWFLDAIKGKDSKYRNYYVWANIDSVRDQIAKKETTLDSDNVTQWHQAEGDTDGDEYYYGFFTGAMPDLNYDNPEVRREMKEIGRFWLEEVGVDGFRLDAARHIYPDDQAEKSHAWWVEFGDAMRAIKPDVYMVGEVWGKAQDVGPYLKGLPSMFNFDFYHGMNRMIKDEANDRFVENLILTQKVYQGIQSNYIDAIFVNNHDQNRLISNVDGNVKKSELSAAILLTLPGMPYVYYGDEIGMLGQKPDPNIREPFMWDFKGKANEQTTWIEAVNSTDETVRPLSVQIDDPGSTYAFFKYWIHVRNENEILRTGELKPLNFPKQLLVYNRQLGDQRWLIIHNLSGEPQRIKFSDLKVKGILHSFDNHVMVAENTLTVPAYASVILE